VDGITYLQRPDGNRKTKNRIILLSIILGVLIVGVVSGFFIYRYYASSTMHLTRAVGKVQLIKENGKSKVIKKTLRFSDGDALMTSSSSLASVSLDNYKIITVDENSLVTFYKDGKNYNTRVEMGGVFFNVKQPLAEDESLKVSTADVDLNITGTSGYFGVLPNGSVSIYVTDGRVSVSAKNPKTQDTRDIGLHYGQMLTIYFHDDSSSGQSIEFTVEEFKPEDMPKLAIAMVTSELEILNRVCGANSWDANTLFRISNGMEGYLKDISAPDEDDTSPTLSQISWETLNRETTEEPTEEPTEELTETPTPSPTKKPSKTPAKTPDNPNPNPDQTDPQTPDTPTPKPTPSPTGTSKPTTTPKPTGTTPTPTGSTPKPPKTSTTPTNSNTPTTPKPPTPPTTTTNPTNTTTTTTNPTATTNPTVVTDPPTVVTDPPTIVTDPPTVVTDPPTVVTDPPTVVTDPPTVDTPPIEDP